MDQDYSTQCYNHAIELFLSEHPGKVGRKGKRWVNVSTTFKKRRKIDLTKSVPEFIDDLVPDPDGIPFSYISDWRMVNQWQWWLIRVLCTLQLIYQDISVWTRNSLVGIKILVLRVSSFICHYGEVLSIQNFIDNWWEYLWIVLVFLAIKNFLSILSDN